MAYRHPRMPLSRERNTRAFWSRSFKPKGKMDRLFAETHPNSERSGCPALWLLFGAATRQLPDDHPVFPHLTDCSPCYREYRGIQQTESFLATWQFRLSRAARGASIRLLRSLRRTIKYKPSPARHRRSGSQNESLPSETLGMSGR
jgi:hypothetical protein